MAAASCSRGKFGRRGAARLPGLAERRQIGEGLFGLGRSVDDGGLVGLEDAE